MKKLVVAAVAFISLAAMANNPELNYQGQTAQRLYESLIVHEDQDVYTAQITKRIKRVVKCTREPMLRAYERGAIGGSYDHRSIHNLFFYQCRINNDLSQWELEEFYNAVDIEARQTRHTMTATKFVSNELSLVKTMSFRPGASADYALVYGQNPIPVPGPTPIPGPLKKTVVVRGVEAQAIYENLAVEEMGDFRPGPLASTTKAIGALSCTKKRIHQPVGPIYRDDNPRRPHRDRPGMPRPGVIKVVYECQMSGTELGAQPF